ncbi:MAG: MOSC domain-containing protein [Neomegalonema sp.]|nr:MOSC domain-containing protein [Neomegalonema sp.]
MIKLRAERLFVHPVKSCAAVEREMLQLSPELGVVGDRAMGLAIDQPPTEGDGVHRRKVHFLHGMRWPEIVRLRPEVRFDPGGPVLNGFALASSDGTAAVALEELAQVGGRLAPGAGEARLVSAYPGRRFSDRANPYVSIINLDTLDAFAAFAGDPALAEPTRWRCNVYVRAGLGAEYGWAREQAPLAVGDAALKTEMLLGRCAMIQAEPELGRTDHPELVQKLRAFENAQGFVHPEERAPVMGVLATPMAVSEIRAGQ